MNTHPIESCAACAEPVDWSAGPHEFVRADGSTAVVCADCCGSIAEAMAPDEQGVHSVEALGDERASAVVNTPADVKGVHSVRTLGDERGVIAAETPADDDATAGKSATWPDGEVASVRQAADEQADGMPITVALPDGNRNESLAARLLAHADKHAEIINGFAEDGETDLAAAFAEVALSFRLVAEVLQNGEDIDRPLDRLMDANARARAVMAERRGA